MYGLTLRDIRNTIAEHKVYAQKWSELGFDGIAMDHIDAIRELFQNRHALTTGGKLTVYAGILSDNGTDLEDTLSDNDRRAFTDAMQDSIDEADKASELVTV